MAAGFKTATVNASDVPATQTNFPSYVDLSRLGITTQAEADSVRVYADSGKTTEWAREIVSVSEMHVKVPSLTSTVTMYVDWDGTSSDYAVTDTYGRNAVWSDYAAVYHMEADMTDSTGGTTGTDTAVTYTTAGKIGDGGSFVEASSARSDVGSIGGTSVAQITVSVWGDPTRQTSAVNNDLTILGYDGWSAVGQFSLILTTRTTTFQNRVNFYVYGETPDKSGDPAYMSSAIPASGFVKMDSIIDTSTKKKTYYLDGALDVETAAFTTLPNVKLDNVLVGSWFVGGGYRSYDNLMDELRVRESILSADWITTEYNNQSDEAGFWGTWSTVSAGANTTDFFIMA